MAGLRGAVKEFLQSRRGFEVRNVAGQVGLTPPVSVRTLLRRLRPEVRVFQSAPLRASNVKGQAKLAVLSTGFFSFRGHLHNDGAVGFNTAFVAAFGRDRQQRPLVVKDEGFVGGVLGSRDHDWQLDGHDVRIAQCWDRLDQVKFSFHAATDAGNALAFALLSVGIVVATGAAVVFAKDADCTWGPEGDSRGAGVGVRCRRESP